MDKKGETIEVSDLYKKIKASIIMEVIKTAIDGVVIEGTASIDVQSLTGESLPVPVKSGDEVVYLDLHEKKHGPHGLVAGTTGSGKSEILQSYILSMATLFHPYEVGFIIIDFKGGGMVNQFRKLPHLNGAITNIDGKEIDRSLLSIRADLQKRQELLIIGNLHIQRTYRTDWLR